MHIIEARDLKGEDLSGSSDPICYVKCLGQKQHTQVHKKTVGCVFDEVFFFQYKSVGAAELDAGRIEFAVYDANTILRNTLIGVYHMDATLVYLESHHEVYRKWVALMDYDNAKDKGIQGFLLVSVCILGPGDEPVVHDRDAEIAAEYLAAYTSLGTEADNAMVLLPPSLDQVRTVFIKESRVQHKLITIL